MSILPTTVPPKKLSQSITAASTSFKVNNIKHWARNTLGVAINLTSADFGSRAFCVFRNDTGTKIEIMEFDPATIASASVTILRRGLGFGGDTSTETTAYKLDWSANETTINFGTDVPQLLAMMAVSYTLMGGSSLTSPADATTYYAGSAGVVIGSTEGVHRIYIPKAGTIRAAYVTFINTGTIGTSETSTVSLRLNATTDTTISAAVTNNAALNIPTSVSKTDLAVEVAQGDFIEIKWVTPTWVTNPGTVIIQFNIYIAS